MDCKCIVLPVQVDEIIKTFKRYNYVRILMTFSKAPKHSAIHNPSLFSLNFREDLLFRKCYLSHCWDRVLFSVCDWTLQVKGSNTYVLGYFASLLPHSLMEKKTMESFIDLNRIFKKPVHLKNTTTATATKTKAFR